MFKAIGSFFSDVLSLLSEVLYDTLTKECTGGIRRFDRMKVMQFVSFNVTMIIFIKHQSKVLDFSTWGIVFGFAIGAKALDEYSKKIGK